MAARWTLLLGLMSFVPLLVEDASGTEASAVDQLVTRIFALEHPGQPIPAAWSRLAEEDLSILNQYRESVGLEADQFYRGYEYDGGRIKLLFTFWKPQLVHEFNFCKSRVGLRVLIDTEFGERFVSSPSLMFDRYAELVSFAPRRVETRCAEESLQDLSDYVVVRPPLPNALIASVWEEYLVAVSDYSEPNCPLRDGPELDGMAATGSGVSGSASLGPGSNVVTFFELDKASTTATPRCGWIMDQ